MSKKSHTAQQVFEEKGFLLLPIGDIKVNLYRLYQTVAALQKNRMLCRLSRFKHPFYWRSSFGKPAANWGILTPPILRSLDRQAHKLATQLPKHCCSVLSEDLQVPLFGGTKAFDHLDFSSWFNGFFVPGTDFPSLFYEAFTPRLGQPSIQEQFSLDQWVADLTVIAELVETLREQCITLTGIPDIRAEHVHIKSWQAREYKAQWWHLDRGEISAIATIAGHPTTEFLLAEDPAPYPEQPIGYDVFVFPEQLNQVVHHCPADDVLFCGARARKERGHSYLWHRAPENSVERIALVLKTLEQ